ncbi:hypothetical protein [Xenophilus azovorans]|uniref:hypothetical protein n=1 Tax=Xenophilus azovorans TaxID=151755 RepID=UPI000571C626|nr:hypothetical protein [Xenophilus azovorans]
MLKAWHYTTKARAVDILGDSILKPSSTGVQPPEKPVVWFSLNQRWEPTANKAIVHNGALRTLTMTETHTVGGGLCRFGIDANKLLTGGALRRRASISHATWIGLTRHAQSGDPRDWFGHVGPLGIHGLELQMLLDPAGEWETIGLLEIEGAT